MEQLDSELKAAQDALHNQKQQQQQLKQQQQQHHSPDHVSEKRESKKEDDVEQEEGAQEREDEGDGGGGGDGKKTVQAEQLTERAEALLKLLVDIGKKMSRSCQGKQLTCTSSIEVSSVTTLCS